MSVQTQAWARRYKERGLAVIPIPGGEKNPNRPGWQDERWELEDIPLRWPPGEQNIGTLLGDPSDGLIDVDLDSPEARIAARYILPPTRTSGRESCPSSHYWYYADPVPATKAYKLPGKGDDRSLVELRSTGAQTLVPPSRHPEGDRYVWGPGEIADVDGATSEEAVADVATAALLARDWPGRGARHDYVLAAAGYVGRRVSRRRAERIMEAAIAASGDEEAPGRFRDVRGTLGRIAAGEPTTGGPTLDELAPGLVDQLRRWHGWGTERAEKKPPEEAPQQNAGHSKGLTVELAEAILAETRFAQNAGGRLHYFSDGVYQPGGEKFIAAKVKALLGAWRMLEKWSSYRSSEVVKYVAADAPELWPRPPFDRVCVQNGILDLERRLLLPHSPEWLSTVQIPVAFDPEATCPAWERQVAQTFPEDATDLAWEIVADLIQPDRSEQVAIIAVGEGNNGKSAYLENIAHFIGRRNRVALSLHRIEVDRFAASRLVGRLANICPDLPSTDLASTSMFKAITGGDEITGEYKYGDSFDFAPFCRLIFSANHLPRSRDASHAFFRRWRVIPFERTFEGGEIVPRRVLDARLREPRELSGVLNKALDALPRLRERGFTESPSMVKAWEEFRQTTDPLAVWLDRETMEGPEAWVTKDDLLNAYNKECARDGRVYLTKKAIAQALKRLRPGISDGQKMVSGKSTTIWKGIGLRSLQPYGDGEGNDGVSFEASHSSDSTDSTVSTVPSNCFEKGEFDVRKVGPTNNNREKPLKPLNPSSTESGSALPEELAAVLANPPGWLVRQLEQARKDPNVDVVHPACSALAYEVYGSSHRWQEAEPVVQILLAKLGEGRA